MNDTSDNLFLLQAFLEAEGFEVETAISGSVALDKLKQSLPDVVLLDVMMPDRNGNDYISKPIDFDRLNPSILRLIDRT